MEPRRTVGAPGWGRHVPGGGRDGARGVAWPCRPAAPERAARRGL